ncbi:MAG: NAD-dependent epimerase/dehydratase family protein [Lachnospiraceae bacterium]|nr:NAD-dependent epimerase/dehydratase family protein [Lachnospiraceae bacterium]
MKYSERYWEDVDRVIGCIPNIKKLYDSSILITGATGMICSCVAEVLFRLNTRKAGINLYLAGRSRERMAKRFYVFQEDKDYVFVEYDATKDMQIDVNPDYIIHGAGNANPVIYTKQPVETMLGNIVGLNSLLRLAVAKETKRVLYISSSEVYGNKSENCPYEERDYGVIDILNPRACYPSAKRAAETLSVSYSAEYGLDTVIVRPGHIYGPTITRKDTRASAQFTWKAVDGQDIIMKSPGTQMRSYCYTLDCASAILTVLLEGVRTEAYNISNKESVVSIREMAETFARYGKAKIIFENASDAESRGFNLMSNSSLSAEKLEQIGWRACFNFEEGIKRTIDYLR